MQGINPKPVTPPTAPTARSAPHKPQTLPNILIDDTITATNINCSTTSIEGKTAIKISFKLEGHSKPITFTFAPRHIINPNTQKPDATALKNAITNYAKTKFMTLAIPMNLNSGKYKDQLEMYTVQIVSDQKNLFCYTQGEKYEINLSKVIDHTGKLNSNMLRKTLTEKINSPDSLDDEVGFTEEEDSDDEVGFTEEDTSSSDSPPPPTINTDGPAGGAGTGRIPAWGKEGMDIKRAFISPKTSTEGGAAGSAGSAGVRNAAAATSTHDSDKIHTYVQLILKQKLPHTLEAMKEVIETQGLHEANDIKAAFELKESTFDRIKAISRDGSSFSGIHHNELESDGSLAALRAASRTDTPLDITSLFTTNDRSLSMFLYGLTNPKKSVVAESLKALFSSTDGVYAGVDGTTAKRSVTIQPKQHDQVVLSSQVGTCGFDAAYTYMNGGQLNEHGVPHKAPEDFLKACRPDKALAHGSLESIYRNAHDTARPEGWIGFESKDMSTLSGITNRPMVFLKRQSGSSPPKYTIEVNFSYKGKLYGQINGGDTTGTMQRPTEEVLDEYLKSADRPIFIIEEGAHGKTIDPKFNFCKVDDF